MSKRNQNIDLYCGEDKLIFIKLDNEDGTPFDPAGAAMEWWLSRTSHSEKIIAKSIGSGSILIVAGGINITLASADTYDLKPEIYYHELKIIKGSTVSVATVGAVHLRPALDMRVVVSP